MNRVIATIPLLLLAFPAAADAQQRRPLANADIDDITRLVMLEDRREFDEAVLGRMLRSQHAEVRRRAAQSIGRIRDGRGRALLQSARTDSDTAVAATVVHSTGQLFDTASVPWLSSLLRSPRTPPTVAREAARALGRIRSADARPALVSFLTEAPASAAPAVVGEALLALGRFAGRVDLASVLRWTTAPDSTIRWRATWALFRPRDPNAVPHLLRLADDANGDVRFWAVRGLAPALVDTAGLQRETVAARLRAAVRDTDRRVRTEALRTLALYDDDASFATVLAALDADDSWLSVSAAEQMARFANRTDAVLPRLISATRPSRPLALRITALAPLNTFAPEAALDLATSLAGASSVVARGAGTQALQRAGNMGRARLDSINALAGAPPAQQPPQPPAPNTPPQRTEAEYRALVARFIVPAYNGAPLPRVLLQTPRGEIEIELHAGEVPLGTEYMLKVIENGDLVGTEFGRVVPNFVAQQRPVRNAARLRDEVTRLGLTRGNLSWASGGLDTGRPGYTLGNTPQPHNEGDFTTLGRVVRGMDAVDRLELGDAITGARVVRR